MAKASARSCGIKDCERLVVARNLCGAHYRRWHIYGDPLAGGPFAPAKASRTCTIEGCSRVHFARGLCSPHLRRDQRHGDPQAGRGSDALGIASRVKPCTVNGCAELSRSRGLCWSHLNRERYQADPDTWARYAGERRARRRGATVERFTPAEIFKRDRWICGLCGRRIGKSYRHPHPRSATLDHVVPLSHGGEHSRRNSQASHRECNLRKGVGGSQQLALIG